MKTGLQRLLDNDSSCLEKLNNRRIGLMAHPASIAMKQDQVLHALDFFAEQKNWQLKALFGPQHGWLGDTQDNMIEWQSSDSYSDTIKIPLYSLYGELRKPSKEMLADIDVLVVDLQDVGCRVYTFIQTLYLIMQACGEENVEVIVLDRPNPIGNKIEGPILQSDFKSFVGLTSIPLRHGMTMGQLAKFYQQEINCNLTVIECKEVNYSSYVDDYHTLWVNPSPNMTCLDTAVVYSGTVLFEASNVSEGRGTTRPFEYIGAPGIDINKLVLYLTNLGLHGVTFRPMTFTPTFHKFTEQPCQGVQVHVLDRKIFHSVLTGVALLKAFRRYYTDFQWLQPPYEYEYNLMPIDILSGSGQLREMIDAERSLSEFTEWFTEEEKTFARVCSELSREAL